MTEEQHEYTEENTDFETDESELDGADDSQPDDFEESDEDADGYVELSPAAQKKFNQQFKQAKQAQERLEAALLMLQKQQATIDELSKFRQQMSARDFQSQIASLQKQEQEAFENGDLDTYRKISGQLIDLRMEAKIAEMQEKKAAKEPPKENVAVDDFYVSKKFEKDANGEYVRSWAFEDDPQYKLAMRHAQEIETTLAHLTPQQQLAELDRRMNTMSKKHPPKVLPPGANLTKNKKGVPLEKLQLDVAKKARIAPEKMQKWANESKGKTGLRITSTGEKEWF